ncbi:MAG: hypothetical protein KAT05_16190 [Spirochaetes bacterium]|nr:hypothetical protein [Spirochaetota bacterium]
MELKLFLSGCFFVLFLMPAVHADIQKGDESCTSSKCHAQILEQRFIHSPVEDDCATCHEQVKTLHPQNAGNEFKLIDSEPDLCYECHDKPEKMKNVHDPFGEGECSACHTPHSSRIRGLLQSNTVCLECHEIKQDKFNHGPVVSRQCNACHSPHQSDNNAYLIKNSPDLCFFCHDMKEQELVVESIHAVFDEDCLNCHLPHSAPFTPLLHTDVPLLCFDCHEIVESTVGNKNNVHGPFKNEGKCFRCHTPHTSHHEYLLKKREQELCFECHNQEFKTETGVVKNIADIVNNANCIHGPITTEGCRACHQAHIPDNYFLLTAEFSQSSYVNGDVNSFAHCFDCHNPLLLETEKTLTATNFRNGDVNLHYLHSKRKKGRNCTTCHDIHGSYAEHLVAEEVSFGKWPMPINYEKRENGGTCLPGCHQEYPYSRTLAKQK